MAVDLDRFGTQIKDELDSFRDLRQSLLTAALNVDVQQGTGDVWRHSKDPLDSCDLNRCCV